MTLRILYDFSEHEKWPEKKFRLSLRNCISHVSLTAMIFFTFISKALSSYIENDMTIAETQIFNEDIFVPIVIIIQEITNEHEKKQKHIGT